MSRINYERIGCRPKKRAADEEKILKLSTARRTRVETSTDAPFKYSEMPGWPTWK
jgi:hypothetical protein